MHILYKLPAAIVAAAFILLTQNVHADVGWPAVYDPKTVLNLNLDMSDADWSTVRNDTTYDIEVPAMFWADGEDPILISVRRKSATALGDKVSLKLDINEYVDQKWNSLKKLSLENGDDADVIAEGYAWYLNRVAAAASASGYTPGLAAWVKLFVNGEYLGVYLNVEQPDKAFLKNRGLYTKNETWLYKASEIWEDHELKVGDPDSPTTALLCYSPFATNDSGGGKKGGGKGKKGSGDSSTCATPDGDSAMATEMNKLIDMRGMLTQGAVSAFTLGNDALFSKGKNFLYIDFHGGEKRRYIPWDLDSVFVPDLPVGSIYGTEKRKRGKIVLSQTAYQEVLLNNPAFRGQYDQIMADLLNGPLQIDSQIAFLNDLEVLLTSALESDPNNNLKVSVAARFEILREWMRGRVIDINEQLGH